MTFMLGYRNQLPLPDLSTFFRDRFLHIILPETMQQITHYPALSCLIMPPPPRPAQITLSFMFNISRFRSEAGLHLLKTNTGL